MIDLNKKAQYQVFIGYDDREPEAYDTCRYSILSQTNTNDVNVIPLKHQDLREAKLFMREWLTDMDGSFIDVDDKKPFSTQFSHSRFLVPEYAKYLGLKGQAIFIDCDFLFFGDIKDLFAEGYAQHRMVSCVKHSYTPATKVKMDNREQVKYNRKLWSALMWFDLSAPALLDKLNKDYCNTATGRELHTFKWLGNEEQSELEIGSLGEQWQYVPDHSEERVPFGNVRAIHYTEGGPWFPHMSDCKYSQKWWAMYKAFVANVLYPYLESRI